MGRPTHAFMLLTYKYRLYPTKAQVEFLDGQLHNACDLYNCALQERIGAWKTCRKSISYYDQAHQLKPMRAEGLLAIVTYDCAQDVLRRLDRAFKAFFSRLEHGNNPGFPQFRSSRCYNSLTFPNPGHGYKLLPNNRLRVQGAGLIKVKIHRPLEGKIKTATIKQEAGRWFVCFSVECDPKPLPASNLATGIDVGLNSFAVLADGTEIKNPRFRQNSEDQLRRCQRKVSRRKKGSKRRRKAIQLLQRAHHHIRNQRSDFHHRLSCELVDKYGMLAVEDLEFSGLTSGYLARPINDAGWAMFIKKLVYKAERTSRLVVKVDPRGTSQTCTCGAKVPKTLANRWHYCRICGLSASRDQVSAQVILQRARNGPSGVNVETLISRVA